jgi:6,7-dimethyl-8-ribityllumazine synthase
MSRLRTAADEEAAVSGEGAPDVSGLDGSDLKVAVVAAKWHGEITDALLLGCRRALAASKVDAVTEVRVPGAFELPVAAKALAPEADAVVALGVVIRGGTPHFDYVCAAATDGLTRVAVDTGVPVGFGLLTCDTAEQALDRAGLPGSSEDKGWEAAMAAVEMALTLRAHRGPRHGQADGR